MKHFEDVTKIKVTKGYTKNFLWRGASWDITMWLIVNAKKKLFESIQAKLTIINEYDHETKNCFSFDLTNCHEEHCLDYELFKKMLKGTQDGILEIVIYS